MFSFPILGFPVRVHWTFWLLAFFVSGGLRARTPEAWVPIVAAMAVIFVSILVHELGHAIAGRRFGSRPSILLYGMGGLCQLPGGRFSRPQHIIVSSAGPAAGFLLAGIFVLIAWTVPVRDPTLRYAVDVGLFVNILWNVLNLVPVLPLDGGQILRDVVGPRGRQVTRWVGAAMATILCVVALLYEFYIAAVIAGFLAILNFQGKTVEAGTVTGERNQP